MSDTEEESREREPDVQVNIWFAPYGWQWTLRADEPDRDGQVRDFGGRYSIEDLKHDLSEAIKETLEKFREAH